MPLVESIENGQKNGQIFKVANFSKKPNSFFGGQTFRQIFQIFFWPHNGQSGNPGIVKDDIAVEILSVQILVDG